MPDHVRHEPISRSIIHNVAYERARLSPVVIVGSERVSGMDELAVGIPSLDVWEVLWLCSWSSLRVRRVDGVGDVVNSHCPVFAVAVNVCLGCIYRDLF